MRSKEEVGTKELERSEEELGMRSWAVVRNKKVSGSWEWVG